jgi:hypothetical protein
MNFIFTVLYETELNPTQQREELQTDSKMVHLIENLLWESTKHLRRSLERWEGREQRPVRTATC